MDLVAVVYQDEGQQKGGLAEEWLKEDQCGWSYSAVVGNVMAYAMVFVAKQYGVRVAGVRRSHRVMSK